MIDPVTIAIALSVATAAAGTASAVQQAHQQSKARKSAQAVAAEQARQLRAAAAQEREHRIRRLQVAQGRTLALAAASGGVDGSGQVLLGQLVRDAQADLAATSTNASNAMGANASQLNANLAQIGSTNMGMAVTQSLLTGATVGLGAYNAASQVNGATATPRPSASPEGFAPPPG